MIWLGWYEEEKTMKRFALIGILVLGAILIVLGCKTGEEEDDIDPQLKIIEGFTLDNYPKVDCSTSTLPLNILIACKALGIRYEWVKGEMFSVIQPILKSKKNAQKFDEKILWSQTHYSIINLIDKKADITLSARKMSPDEKTYADAAGVSLIETPIALDAFVFIINPENPITSITIEQIQDIYTGKITKWSEVGDVSSWWQIAGNPAYSNIRPYVRNPNSGSQELMESLVMKDMDIDEFPVSWEEISSMTGANEMVASDDHAICYAVYYFIEYMHRVQIKKLSIGGIYPGKENISNNIYPLTTEVYAMIRSDLDKSSMAYKLYELLQTEAGKKVISESGYVTN
jgi:phosphate transport system substrate-binding protein